MNDKGTITYFDIKDAPKDGTKILIAGYCEMMEEPICAIAWWDEESNLGNGAFRVFGLDFKPTHFAFINLPEVPE